MPNKKRCPLTKENCWQDKCELWVKTPINIDKILGWSDDQWLTATGKSIGAIRSGISRSRKDGVMSISYPQAAILQSDFLKTNPEPPREFTSHCGLRKVAGQ